MPPTKGLKIPDRVTTYSMSETLELHIATAAEDGHIIRLSDEARRMLIKGLENQAVTMREYGHSEEAVKDSITCAIYAFVAGYEISK